MNNIAAYGCGGAFGSITELTTGTDGFVRLYVDSSRLEAGPYLLVITPAEDRTATSTTAFRVKVVAR